MEKERSLVSLRGCGGYGREEVAAAVKELLEPLGGMGAFVDKGDRVLLKPNLIVGRAAEAAVTTHPEVVRAAALEVIEAGGKPFIGDSPAFGSAAGVARQCGLGEVAKELGLEIVDLGKKPRPRRIDDQGVFHWAGFGAAALEADAIVNLPKVKAHIQMGMSLGLKNMFGVVAGKRKAIFHMRNGRDHERFGRMLVAVARYLKPALTIEDGVWSLERGGPIHGDPKRTGFLAASGDVWAADRAVLEVLGVDPETVPYMAAARKMGFGGRGLEDFEIVGDSIESLAVEGFVAVKELSAIKFSVPRVMKSIAKQLFHVAKGKLKRKA